MGRRALLIGSQTGGLTGVHRDVRLMAETLGGFDFDVRTIIESEATSEGIVSAYGELIDDTDDDDAVVVYYSGHGSRTLNPKADGDPSLPSQLQYIVPTDIDDRSDSRFRGILAEELSALQRRLTDTTTNVTTIVDCCHSARMFRDHALLPKADDQLGFPWDDVVARWQRVRSEAGHDLGDVNPHAVQVVACEPQQSAYELSESSIGGAHGALTAELVSVLRRPDALRLTWREVIEIIRPAILDVVPFQRPDILGRQAERQLFSLDTRSATGVLGVGELDGKLWIEGAALFGVADGDSYALVAPGSSPDDPIAVGVVDVVTGDRGRLSFANGQVPELPAGTLAHPLEVSLGRRPVVVRPPDHPDRDELVDAFRRSVHVRIVDAPPAAGALATVALDDDGMLLLDAQQLPLWADPRPVTDTTVGILDRSLTTLARATHVRELESGSGATALPDAGTAQVSIRFSRIDPASGDERPIASGEHLHVGDALVVRVRNATSQQRYVSLLDVGLTGAITLVTATQPSGVGVEPDEEYVIGQNPAGVIEGIAAFWPDGLVADAPRSESLVALVADHPVDGLPALTQSGIRTRDVTKGVQLSSLERVLENVSLGMRDVRPDAGAPLETRYRVERLDFVLHPTTRPAELSSDEPAFEIDTRPDPSFRLVTPRSATSAPERVSVRLAELVVHSNRSLLRSKVRLDFLAMTTAGDGSVEPFLATTRFFDRIRDGDRLPFDDMLIYDGGVSRFLDLAVWVSRADEREVSLAELIHAELGDAEVAGAVTTLAALAVTAPAAAAVAGSAAAVATLVRTGARVLSAVSGSTIGTYRTSLLPHERFGAGRPVRRHPSGGLIRSQDMSFAYEVVDAGG